MCSVPGGLARFCNIPVKCQSESVVDCPIIMIIHFKSVYLLDRKTSQVDLILNTDDPILFCLCNPEIIWVVINSHNLKYIFDPLSVERFVLVFVHFTWFCTSEKYWPKNLYHFSPWFHLILQPWKDFRA